MNRHAFASIPLVLATLAFGGATVLGGWFYFGSSTPFASTSSSASAAASSSAIVEAPPAREPFLPIVPMPTLPGPMTILPTQGPIGTTVVIRGSGFAATNTIEMNGLVAPGMAGVPSADGKTLTFTVPGILGPYCSGNRPCPLFRMMVHDGTYAISVISGGVSRSAGSFTVTGAAAAAQ